uniref:IRS-type PTB domain-containing protein n=1 Tax=Oryzias latipes TaxID=8090 RepID=A0A3P9II77_ORYLA
MLSYSSNFSVVQKHGHKRFFVLRAAGPLGPSRLEYYDSEKKFRSTAAANKYLIALYTKDEYFAIVAESEQEQEDWYVAVSALMSEGKRGHVDSDDLDDGYGTVSPGTVFKEVWQVNVKPKGLGQTKNLTGVYRLCLSAKTVHLVKLNSDNPCVNLQLMNIRRCGHSESFFFIEVGRSSSIGPGEIWMQVDDSVVAQSMHETILETMKALKAFAEFRPRSKSQSSSSNPMPFITTRSPKWYELTPKAEEDTVQRRSLPAPPPQEKGSVPPPPTPHRLTPQPTVSLTWWGDKLPDGPTRHPLTVCGCLWRGSETHQLPMTHQEPQRPRPLPLPRRPDPAECAGTRLPASRTDSTTSPWS